MVLVRFLVQRSLTLLIFSLVAGISCAISSVLVLALINKILSGSVSRFSYSVIGAYIALVLIVTLGKSFSFALLARLVQKAVHELRTHLAKALIETPLRTIEEKGAAELFVKLTDDITAVANGLAAAPLLLINAAIVLGCGIYLTWLSWPMALGLFLTVILWLSGYLIPANFAMRKLRVARKEQDTLMECFRGMIEGNKELKLSQARRKAFLELEFQNSATHVRDSNLRAMEALAGAIGWGQSLSLAMIGMTLFFFDVSSTPVGTAGVLAVLFLIGPLEALVLQAPTLARSRIALDSLSTLTCSLTPEKIHEAENIQANPEWERIQMDGLKYSYQTTDADSTFHVGPIDFVLTPGEIVFVVGGNGSGKSTFFKLLAGLYPPDEGELYWNDSPLSSSNLSEYRGLFSAIFADHFLFRSLVNASPEAIDRVEQYIKRLHLQDKVSISDGKFSTLSLSQGQRHRLALVAAYLEDRPIYLFDEWAASQDPVFRRVFYRELLPEFKARGKTVLVISHDEEFYDAADRIVKLHLGCIERDCELAI